MSQKTRDKRCFRRYSKKFPARVSGGQTEQNIEILDYSLDGIGVIAENYSGVSVGDILTVDNAELSISGKYLVEWFSRTHAGLRMGLHTLEPLRGSIKSFGLPDVLIGLQRSLKNGTLIVKSGSIEKKVYIRNGDMIYARSNLKMDSLGDILLREGLITMEAYNRTSALMSETGKKQGTLLVECGALTPKDLPWAVNHRVEEIIVSLFTIGDGTFDFREDSSGGEKVIPLKLLGGRLIYRGLKTREYFENMKDSFELLPSTVIAFSHNPLDLFQDIPFDDEDRRFLSCIDGKRSIQEIIALSGLEDSSARKSLFALINTGIIEASETEEEGAITYEDIAGVIVPPRGLVEKIEKMHSEFSMLDYYSILGVNESATENGLRIAFYNIAREFHPDRHFYLEEDIKEKLHNIFSIIVRCYNVLSSPQKRREYDRSLAEKQLGATREVLARQKFDEGFARYMDEDLEAAAKCFEEAVHLDDCEAPYYFLLGRVLSDLNRYKSAERAFLLACKLNPHNDKYYAELGHFYMMNSQPGRADPSFRKALECNSANKRAKEGLRIIAKGRVNT